MNDDRSDRKIIIVSLSLYSKYNNNNKSTSHLKLTKKCKNNKTIIINFELTIYMPRIQNK